MNFSTTGRPIEILLVEDSLKYIPVVILTTSQAEQDVVKAYGLHANCYINKPVDFGQFTDVVRAIEQFWFTVVLPATNPATRNVST